jgi:hypothetical protein
MEKLKLCKYHILFKFVDQKLIVFAPGRDDLKFTKQHTYICSRNKMFPVDNIQSVPKKWGMQPPRFYLIPKTNSLIYLLKT